MPLSYDPIKFNIFKQLSLLPVTENYAWQSNLEKFRNYFSQNFEINKIRKKISTEMDTTED